MSPFATVRVGTAGWNVSSRYFSEIPTGNSHLERYANMLRAVEIDTSFHRHHKRATYARWANSVGEEFRFAVKTPRTLTHEGELVAGGNAAFGRFLEEVAGLGVKLGVLLIQLPPSLAFEASRAMAFFAELRRATHATVAIACEPRHPSWSSTEANTLLMSSGVSRVAADPPRWEGNALPGGDHRLAYFRLHGSPRTYYSDYAAAQLETLANRLENATRTSRSVWCIFDNTAEGHALGNALAIQRRFSGHLA